MKQKSCLWCGGGYCWANFVLGSEQKDPKTLILKIADRSAASALSFCDKCRNQRTYIEYRTESPLFRRKTIQLYGIPLDTLNGDVNILHYEKSKQQ